MGSFEDGYGFFEKLAGANTGAAMGEYYIGKINSEIGEVINNLNSMKGYQTSVKALKGDVAEFWQSGTFNIKAALNDSDSRTVVDRSHDFASADISSNFGDSYGLKYYAEGQASAKAQSTSIFQRFKEYQAGGGKDGLDKFLTDRGYTDADSVLYDPIYSGQLRVIPHDQLEEATQWLERMIKTEATRRPNQVKRYQDTLNMLRDKLSDGKGTESIPLTREEAEKLAALAKEGKVNAEALGLTTEGLVQYEYILKQAGKAGLTAATISLVLKTAPEIYKAIDFLIQTGEVDNEQFKKIGFAAVNGSSEGFVRGSVAAAITTSCKAGILGETLKEVNPSVIGAVTVIAMNAMKNSYGVAVGKKTKQELANELIHDSYVSACSLILGGVAQSVIEIPVLGYMLGSFVGSMIGSFTYNVENKMVISFSVDTGFTMFGLVKQDYALPEDVLKEIGVDTFKYDTFETDRFEPDTFSYETFRAETFEPASIGIKYLSRGVIGVSKVGYIN